MDDLPKPFKCGWSVINVGEKERTPSCDINLTCYEFDSSHDTKQLSHNAHMILSMTNTHHQMTSHNTKHDTLLNTHQTTLTTCHMTLTLITETHRVFVIVINEDVGSLHDLTGENYWQRVECIAGVRG